MNRTFIIGALMVLCFLVYANVRIRELNTQLEQNLEASFDSIKTFKDKYSQAVSQIKSYEIHSRDLKKLNDSLQTVIKNYKPIVVNRWHTKYVYKDTVKIKYDTIIQTAFTVPFVYNSKWLSLTGLSTNLGIDINKIEIPNTQSLIVGYKRDNLFSRPYASVSIANTNPYITVNNIDSYVVKPKKTIFDKWWFWGGLGAVTTFIIVK